MATMEVSPSAMNVAHEWTQDDLAACITTSKPFDVEGRTLTSPSSPLPPSERPSPDVCDRKVPIMSSRANAFSIEALMSRGSKGQSGSVVSVTSLEETTAADEDPAKQNVTSNGKRYFIL